MTATNLASVISEPASSAVQRRQRVLFINRSYYPDCEATGQLLTELTEDLEHQFSVEVICGYPNKNLEGRAFRESGSDSYRGIDVQRVQHTRYEKSLGKRKRAINMVTFLWAAVWAALTAKRPQVVVCETDPPLLCFIGVLLQKLRGAKYVAYLQDIYPDVAHAMRQLPSWFPLRLSRWLFHSAYRSADRVVVLSRDMRDFLVRIGVRPERIVIVPNWVDTRAIQPVKVNNPFREQHRLSGKFVVMYSGNMGLSQPLETIVEAADRLRQDPDVVFYFVGDGARRKSLEAHVQQLQLPNCVFLDYQPKDTLAASLSAADLHIVFLEPDLVPYLMPSKFYGVLASGTPTAAITAADSELADFVARENVGQVIADEHVTRLCGVIAHYRQHPWTLQDADRCHQLAVANFSRSIATQRFAEVLERLDGAAR